MYGFFKISLQTLYYASDTTAEHIRCYKNLDSA